MELAALLIQKFCLDFAGTLFHRIIAVPRVKMAMAIV
jgi:hypothetical protein